MRVPLSLTASMTGYLARKSLTGAQEVSAGADARAAARLQPDLHRLRPHPRVRVDDQGEAHRRGVPGGGRRVRRADRLDLRRRADDLSRDRRAGREILERKKHIYLCTNGMFIRKKLQRVQAHVALLLQRPPRRPGEDARHRRRARRRLPRAIEGIKAAKEAGFLVCTNTTVYKETDMDEIDELFAYLPTLGRRRLHDLAGLRYAAVKTKEIFMTRDDIREKFRAGRASCSNATTSSPRRSTWSSSGASAS